MNHKRIAAVFLRQVYLIKCSLSRLLSLFIWIMIDMVLWGFITRYLSSITLPGANIVTLLLGAVLLWDFFSRVMYGVTTAFFEDVWSRNFLNVFSTPLTVKEYLSGLVLCSIVTSLAGLLLMLILASAVFGLSILVYGAMLVPFLLVLFMFGVAMGIASCAVVLRLGPASEWFIWPLPAVVSPFAGVFYPVSTLPVWMQYMAYLLPPSYVFEGMRAVVSGGMVSGADLLLGGGLAVLYILLAGLAFAGTYRYAVRTGLIARYSAENVS